MQDYRRDIDGLRAIAIALVVLGHAHMAGFSGGFAGVDVFFVISGFLITGILHKDGGPDLARFYERRIRRIVPALALVVAVSTVAAFILMSPYELSAFSKSLIASTVFAANFFFSKVTTYFAPTMEVPFLHLWSLSVEEQFYIGYPIILLGLKRWAPKQVVPVLIAIFLLSLVLSQAMIGGHKEQAFYFAGSRAFELMLGALVAVFAWQPKLPKLAAEGAALLGLALILIPAPLFDSNTPWPGLHAMVPCAGVALLIGLHAQNDTVVRRLLSTPPFVGLGLISYSLYLWHWPLFEYFSRWILREPTASEYGLLIIAGILIAALSWRYVEQPLRRIPAPRAYVFGTAALTAAAFLAIAGATLAFHGLPQRFTPDVARLYAMIDLKRTDHPFIAPSSTRCFVHDPKKHYAFDLCFRPANDRSTVLLWGDSLGHSLISGLAPVAEKHSVRLIEATFGACRPGLDDPESAPECRAFNRAVYQHLDNRIDTVILTARIYTHEDRVPVVRDLAKLLAARGIKVVMLGPQPEYPRYIPLVVVRYRETGDTRLFNTMQSLIPDLRRLDTKMRAMFSAVPNVTYISALDTICGKGPCPVFAGSAPYVFDRLHLSTEGSALLAAALWPKLQPVIAAKRPSHAP